MCGLELPLGGVVVARLLLRGHGGHGGYTHVWSSGDHERHLSCVRVCGGGGGYIGILISILDI